MSKLSRVLLIIMITALAYMGAVRGYQWYQRKAEAYNEAHPAPSLFQTQEETAGEPVEVRPWTAGKEDIFLEQQPLSEVLQEQQAKETIESILSDYRMNPAFRRFNAELERVTKGKVSDFGQLSNQSLSQILKDNPEIEEVVRKNMERADFTEVLQQIFSNPQYQQSVAQLQGGDVPSGTNGPVQR